MRFIAHHFTQLLKAQGIQIGGGSPSTAEPKHELLKHESPPLLAIIKSIHASSDNHETECVFRMLGVKAEKAPDVVIREHWKPRGLDFIGQLALKRLVIGADWWTKALRIRICRRAACQ